MVISPCISICKTDPLTGYCYGCGRSNEDKQMWKDEKTSDRWKKIKAERRQDSRNIFFHIRGWFFYCFIL